MTDSDGRVGWGEAPALKDWGGEFRPILRRVNIDCRDGDQQLPCACTYWVSSWEISSKCTPRMDAVIKGYPYAKASLDFAAYDPDRPLASGCRCTMLLGGRAPRERVPVTHSIGLIFDRRRRRRKWRFSSLPRAIKHDQDQDRRWMSGRDIEMVRTIRETVGDDVELCVDANEGYRHPRRGDPRRSGAMEPKYRLKYVEQPVMGIERIAEVARAIDAPVMADESAWNAHDVIQISERRAAQIVSIYTTKPGGLYKAMEVAAVCRAAGIICNVNGSGATGVGNLRRRSSGGCGACCDAVMRRSGVYACRMADRSGWRHLLPRRPHRRADEARGRGDRSPNRSRHGHRCRLAKIEKYRVRN